MRYRRTEEETEDRALAVYWLRSIEMSGEDARDEHYQAEHRREVVTLPAEKLRAQASYMLNRAMSAARMSRVLSGGYRSDSYVARFWGAIAACYALAGGGWGRWEPKDGDGRWVGTPGPHVHPAAEALAQRRSVTPEKAAQVREQVARILRRPRPRRRR